MVSLDDNQSSREHRTTQTKTPARHILTPTPPPKKKQQTTKGNNVLISWRTIIFLTFLMLENFDSYSSKHTYLIHIAIVHVLQILNRIKTRAFKINITSSSMTFDDPVEEHEFSSEREVDFDDNAEQEEEDENEKEEEEEELLKIMTVEPQRDIQYQPYVNNDDDRDIAIHQRRPLNEHQQIHNRNFTDAISKLVNHMDSHHEKVEKQLKMFSKTIQRTTVASGLDLFCRDDELFPDIVSFNNQNLLDTYDSGSPGQFARSILKKLFTPAEMCESILYPNDNYTKPGLDECGF
ncbi:unnamed protein product [Rotaria magnacalcarata]|uniref:Uncharacterized protein n=1 Tax=Rotaria magnacalcarata TaxID=392030 RepID=A0A816WW83_9BILA|nr:unnamed protein product [Rotaria magnacalcarata]